MTYLEAKKIAKEIAWNLANADNELACGEQGLASQGYCIADEQKESLLRAGFPAMEMIYRARIEVERELE